MPKDDYLKMFIDDDDLKQVKKDDVSLPCWVTRKNSSYYAYKAIVSLREDKRAFIKKHGMKSQYVKKSNYRIQKSEIARLTNKKAQPLFNSNSYSKDLSDFFNEVNSGLEEEKEQRIRRSKRGINNKRKEDLISEHKELIKSHRENQLQVVSDQYQKVLDNLPLDVKRKLKLG